MVVLALTATAPISRGLAPRCRARRSMRSFSDSTAAFCSRASPSGLVGQPDARQQVLVQKTRPF